MNTFKKALLTVTLSFSMLSAGSIMLANPNHVHTYGAPGFTISEMSHGWWSMHYATARRVL